MITSVQNEQVKSWKKLKRKKGREKEQSFLVEGFHLVEEAIKSSWEIKELVIREDVPFQDEWKSYRWFQVNNTVFNEITETEHPQGIAAVVSIQTESWGNFPRLLLIDSVQDPGNLGTLIRTADAAGFDAVILGKGTVDPFNDKVLRATQGSIFHLPLFQGDLNEWIPQLRDLGTEVWASALQGAVAYNELTPPTSVALLVGNEGAGVDSQLLPHCDKHVKIPMYGQAESLNVAIAAGILLYYLRN